MRGGEGWERGERRGGEGGGIRGDEGHVRSRESMCGEVDVVVAGGVVWPGLLSSSSAGLVRRRCCTVLSDSNTTASAV